MILRIPVALL